MTTISTIILFMLPRSVLSLSTYSDISDSKNLPFSDLNAS